MDHSAADRSGGLALRLVEEGVLLAVVEQLRKDLATDRVGGVTADAGAFEALRTQVRAALEARQAERLHALQVVLYRVDVPERVARKAMAAGGLHELAGCVVLRCLQKVITRLHLRQG